jgi:transposase-like protein
MKNPVCPYCQDDASVINHGQNHTGSRRYRCQRCHRYFTPEPKPEGYPAAVRDEALKLSLAGMSFRKIGKHLGVHHQSVANWVAIAAARLPETVADQEPTPVIEMDELFTFVGEKKTRSTS